jgi:hypothetical protein
MQRVNLRRRRTEDMLLDGLLLYSISEAISWRLEKGIAEPRYPKKKRNEEEEMRARFITDGIEISFSVFDRHISPFTSVRSKFLFSTIHVTSTTLFCLQQRPTRWYVTTENATMMQFGLEDNIHMNKTVYRDYCLRIDSIRGLAPVYHSS